MTKEIKIAFLNEALVHSAREPDMAYIKKETLNDNPVWTVYNTDGEKMGYAATREIAFAVARQNAYIGVSVH